MHKGLKLAFKFSNIMKICYLRAIKTNYKITKPL